MTTQYRPYTAKSMINKLGHVDEWFWASYTVNPYRGCAHGCIYCDARANQYGLTDSFDDTVYVKDNALRVLERQLRNLQRGVVSTGGVCDSYQLVESERGLTRRVVEALGRHGFPVEVLTKSDLVLRDLELYQEINRRTWSCVFFTITTFDEQIASRFEAGAPPPERRLEAMRMVAKAGLTTGVAMMPLLPGITDGDDNIKDVVTRVRDAGGEFVLGGGLTLKQGVQRSRYVDFLQVHHPDVVSLHERLYADGLEPRGTYGPRLLRSVRDICDQYGISDRMRRPILPDDPLRMNKRIAERLFLRAYDLLLEDAKSHRQWAYRKAAWAVDEMESDIGATFAEHGTKGLEGIRGVGSTLAAEIEGWLSSADQASP